MSALSPLGAYNIEKSTDGGETWSIARCYLGSWADRCLTAAVDLGETEWVADDGTRFRFPRGAAR